MDGKLIGVVAFVVGVILFGFIALATDTKLITSAADGDFKSLNVRGRATFNTGPSVTGTVTATGLDVNGPIYYSIAVNGTNTSSKGAIIAFGTTFTATPMVFVTARTNVSQGIYVSAANTTHVTINVTTIALPAGTHVFDVVAFGQS